MDDVSHDAPNRETVGMVHAQHRVIGIGRAKQGVVFIDLYVFDCKFAVDDAKCDVSIGGRERTIDDQDIILENCSSRWLSPLWTVPAQENPHARHHQRMAETMLVCHGWGARSCPKWRKESVDRCQTWGTNVRKVRVFLCVIGDEALEAIG